MPTFQYEAMDNTGLEVKDTIDAASEQEAQSRIREKGFFVTKITEKGRAKKTKADGKTKGDGKTRRKRPPRKRRPSRSAASAGRSCVRSLVSCRRCRTPACRSCAACVSWKASVSPVR